MSAKVIAGRQRRRILVVNDPHGMRISADLAVEIGLPESLLLLQLEFLISISDNERDGRYWTYQTLVDLRDNYFKFWSISTLSRAIKRLVELELIIVGNFNRAGFDRTQWFAINEVGVERLSSIGLATSISHNAKSGSKPGNPLHDEISILQDAKSILREETAIPETTSETTPEKNGQAREKDASLPVTTPDPRAMTLEQRIAWTEERERNRKVIAAAERAMLGGRR